MPFLPVSSSNSALPVSIRLNPFKEAELSHLKMEDNVLWSPYGRYLQDRPSFTLDPLFHAGAYYVQDSSAMFVGWVFRQAMKLYGRTCRVADVCAAPGGKTTDILTSLRESEGSDFLLVSNEVIKSRASVLIDNVARWGDPNVVVTSSDPEDFRRLPGFFDIILTDVPCSGEGMFRKSANAREMWSEDNVALCAARSRRIVSDVWDSLSDGGFLIYSTCTLNDEENDANVEWIIERFGAEVTIPEMNVTGPERTKYGYLLTPGVVRGEGQYCALLRKRESVRDKRSMSGVGRTGLEFFSKDDFVFVLPEFVAEQMNLIGKKLNVLNAGIRAFVMKGKDRIPYADLALSGLLRYEDFPVVELPLEQALHFLHRDSLILPDCPLGYVAVAYQGLPIGFIKNIGSRANNLLPPSRRILMDIE